MSKKEKLKNSQQSKDKKTSSSSSQHQTSSNDQEGDLSNFISQQEEQIEDIEINTEQKSGIEGMDPSSATTLLTSLLANQVPEEKRQEFKSSYAPVVEQILNFVGFEEMTEGANVESMPKWVRILIAVVGIGGFTALTLKKYKDPKPEQKQKKKAS